MIADPWPLPVCVLYGPRPMKIGLVGFPSSGKSTVFGALTGLTVDTGYAAARGKANVGAVKVPDSRVDALAALYQPKKITYAEVIFTDLGGEGLDRKNLNAMREVDALCQVVRAFPDASGEAPHDSDELPFRGVFGQNRQVLEFVRSLCLGRSEGEGGADLRGCGTGTRRACRYRCFAPGFGGREGGSLCRCT